MINFMLFVSQNFEIDWVLTRFKRPRKCNYGSIDTHISVQYVPGSF